MHKTGTPASVTSRGKRGGIAHGEVGHGGRQHEEGVLQRVGAVVGRMQCVQARQPPQRVRQLLEVAAVERERFEARERANVCRKGAILWRGQAVREAAGNGRLRRHVLVVVLRDKRVAGKRELL